MPRLEYFLVAESVSVDQVTNRVSIFNVVEQVRITTFPCTLPNLVAVAMWEAEEGDADRDFQAGIVFSLPDGEKLPEFCQNFRIAARRHRTMAYIQGLPVKKTGTIRVNLSLNGDYIASHTIHIIAAKDQPAPPP